MRINKYISETGICSRREADHWVEMGRVTLNGVRAELGSKVQPGDEVRIDGQMISEKRQHIYIALNKPIGITCTTELHVKGNIIDYINHPERIFPIGRLDKDSEGLILLTNHGDIVNKILRAENHHEKEYVVTVDKPITAAFLEGMAGGVPILGTMTKPCTVTKVADQVFRIILTQGLNRQIRRMCVANGYQVRHLQRIRIMDIVLTDLKVGDWRELTGSEREKLFTDIELI